MSWSRLQQDQDIKINCILYATSEKSENETKKIIPFAIESKRITYTGLNLTKEVQDLYTENCKTLFKEMKQLSKWKDVLCSWIRIANIALQIQQNLYQNLYPNWLLYRNGQAHPKI